MTYLYTFPLWAPALLLLSYIGWAQTERGGWWVLCWLFAIVSAPLDILLAHTLFPFLMSSYPLSSEWTFSQQISRLCKERQWERELYLKRVLNGLAPNGNHI